MLANAREQQNKWPYSLINRKDEDNLNKEITNFIESHLYNDSILDNLVDLFKGQDYIA